MRLTPDVELHQVRHGSRLGLKHERVRSVTWAVTASQAGGREPPCRAVNPMTSIGCSRRRKLQSVDVNAPNSTRRLLPFASHFSPQSKVGKCSLRTRWTRALRTELEFRLFLELVFRDQIVLAGISSDPNRLVWPQVRCVYVHGESRWADSPRFGDLHQSSFDPFGRSPRCPVPSSTV